MGYYVEYVLDVPGVCFANKLPDGILTDETWEGEIPNSAGELIAQTDGQITLLSYAEIKYSWIIHEHTESAQRIELMDIALRILFPSTRLVRLDERLLDNWTTRYSDDLHKSLNAFDKLLQWLITQDDLYWKHFPAIESAG